MSTKKTVLIADYDKTVRTTLSVTLRELGLNVFEANNGVNAMKIVKNHNIDLIITNLLLSTLGGIDFIKNVQMVYGHTEIIVISDIVNSAIFERMRKLGVFSVFQIPFKLDEIKDAVMRGIPSVRIDRLNASDPHSSCMPRSFLRFIVAHHDNTILQKVHQICVSKRYAVDHADTQENLMKFLSIGSYDVIVTSESLLRKLHTKELRQVFSGVCKPILFILSKTPEKPVKLIDTLQHSTFYLSPSFMKETFIGHLQSALPSYIDSRERSSLNWETRKKTKRPIVSHLHYRNLHPKKVFRPLVGFYFVIIILAGFIGFWVSNLIEKKPREETVTSREIEILRYLERYKDFEKMENLRRQKQE